MLKDKVALITGGSGAIGAKICEVFAREGAQVAFTTHKNTKNSSSRPAPKNSRSYPVEITSEESVRKTADKVLKDFGTIDVLVNCIGFTQILPFTLIEGEDWDNVMAVNLKGMFLMTKYALPPMINNRKGSILNMGSLAGHRMLEVPVHYATAKAGVAGFTISLAKELSRYKIRVNSIVPGLIDDGVGLNVPQKQLAEYSRYCASGRPGKVGEVAELAAFIVSDRASYINAQNIFVDGGI